MHRRPSSRILGPVAIAAAVLLVTSCDGDRATAPRLPASPALSTSASLMFFDANAPGEYGGVAVGISPFASGGPFGGFQSAPGTGVMSDIVITFGVPVSSVTITALDPTWAGNLMITSGPAGVIDSYAFAYTNQPGNNVPDAHTVSGAITSVHLVAAAGEYIAYRMQIGVPAQPSFTVTCGSPIERGQMVTCSASPVNATATLEVAGWRFASTDPQVPFTFVRDEDPTATTWAGTMVISGTVTVTGKVSGGAEEEQSANIVVTPRAWTNMPIPAFPVNYIGQGALPEEPHAPGELGEIHFYGDYTIGRAFAAGAIGNASLGGPNSALVYVKAVPPFVDRAEVSANEKALTKGSAFWFAQKENNPNLVFDGQGACEREVVTAPSTLEKIKAHEGTAFQDKSHSFYFKQAADAKVGPAVEGLVASESEFTARWTAALDAVWAEADAASKKTDEVAKLKVGCNFNFNYQSKQK